jgi:hypothetical protein
MSKYLKINQIINQVEQLFPVHTWKVNDLDAWVLIRLQLGWVLLEHLNQIERKENKEANISSATLPNEKSSLPDENNSHQVSVAHEIIKKLKRWVGLTIYYIRFYQEAFFYKYLAIKQIQKKADYLFFVPGSSVCQINIAWFNQFADPIVSIITKKKQANCVVLEANNGKNKSPRFHKNYYGFEKLIGHHLHKYPHQLKQSELGQYEDFLIFLKKNYEIKYDSLNKEKIVHRLVEIERLSQFFQHLLDKNKPEKIFLICYYWDWAMALIYACYQKGIKTIEIQHGSQENWFPYAKWVNLPTNGYNMLPDYFWCWTKGETKQINDWAEPVGRHLAFEGGHVWLSFFNSQNFIQDAFKNQHEIFAKVKKEGKKVILYTGQPLSDRFLSDSLISIIKETAEDCIWWLRVHPRLLDKMEIFQQEIKEVGIQHLVEITNASTLPLPLLLRYTDLHITQESSSVIEAYLCNVPSIILSEDGSVFYEFVQEQKYAFCYKNLQSNSIKDLLHSFSNVKQNNLHAITLESTIQKIIQNKSEQLCYQ